MDNYGDLVTEPPDIMLHSCVDLEFDLRSEKRNEEGILEPFDPAASAITGWYFAVDRDFDRMTVPKILITDGITLKNSEDRFILHIPIPDTGTPALLEDMNNQASRKYTAEIGGFDADARPVVTWQFSITVKNRIFFSDSGITPPEITSPEYYTALEIKSMLSGKADRLEVYTKTEIDNLTGNIETLLSEI